MHGIEYCISQNEAKMAFFFIVKRAVKTGHSGHF